MLQPIFLIVIPRLQIHTRHFLVGFLQIFECGYAAGIVGCDGWTTEALSEDRVAITETFRIEGLRKDAALDLMLKD